MKLFIFDSFGVEHIPKEIKKFISNENIKANIYRVQANDSIMCGYFCIGFVDFFLVILKMQEIDKTKLPDRTKFRLYEIKKLIIILSMRLINKNHTVKN